MAVTFLLLRVFMEARYGVYYRFNLPYRFKEIAMAWSEEKKNETREKIGPGAMVKNGQRQYGFVCTSDDGIKILGVQRSGFLAVPSDEIVATFTDVEEMIAAGWVID